MVDRRVFQVAAAAAVAIAVAACGSASGTKARVTAQQTSTTGQTQSVVDIYSSLPLSGPQASEGNAIVRGIRTGLAALEQPANDIDGYKVVYHPLNDANRKGWNAELVVKRASRVASDPRAMLYIGDLDSGATEIALPILNQAGIVDITPASSYIGLTDSVAGGVTQPGEPDRFYPNPKLRNLLRLIPNEMVQVAAVLDALAKVGPCQKVAAVSFGSTLEGPSAVHAVSATSPAYGMTFVTTKGLASGATTAELTAYVQALHDQSVNCLVLTGKSTPTAATLVRLVHAYLPHDQVIAMSGYCNAPLKVAGWYCASPVLPLSSYRNADIYIQEYRRLLSTRAVPSQYGIYGYVAAEVAVYAIDALVDDGIDMRTQVQRALIGSDVASEIIGAFDFDDEGNISDHRVGIYRADAQGTLQLYTVLSPNKVVGGGG